MDYNNILETIKNEISMASAQYIQKQEYVPESREDTDEMLNKIALEIQRKGG